MRRDRPLLLYGPSCEFQDKVEIVRRVFVLEYSLRSHPFRTLRTLIEDHVLLLRMRVYPDRPEHPATGVRPVPRIDVDVLRPEAERAVISGSGLSGGGASSPQ